jgi:hypothetical protein
MTKHLIPRLLALAAVLVAIFSTTAISFGSAPTSATLKHRARAVEWAGTLARAAAPTGEAPECAATPCDRFDLSVDLPAGIWNKPGGLEVAVRWPLASFSDNLRLYVYHDGALVAKSDGIISSAQSVLLPEAANGQYSVYVALDPDSSSASIAYEGLAEVEYAPKQQPARQLQPDLEPRPQRNLTFDAGGIFFDTVSAEHPSCYQSEVSEQGARTCLRFDQVFANVGEGPLELRFAIPRDPGSSARDIFQRIYRSDPPAAYDERAAGQWVYHAIHQHYHYTGFGLSLLWPADASGRRAAAPIRAKRHSLDGGRPHGPPEPVRSGRKVGFCLADTELDFWLQKGNGPRTYNAPDCLFPAFSDAQNDYLVQGITPGWADVYDWYLPDQYIEVTGVRDGTYILETIADPDNTLLEADETNNCTAVLIRLSDMGTPAPHAQLLGAQQRCPSAGG